MIEFVVSSLTAGAGATVSGFAAVNTGVGACVGMGEGATLGDALVAAFGAVLGDPVVGD